MLSCVVLMCETPRFVKDKKNRLPTFSREISLKKGGDFNGFFLRFFKRFPWNDVVSSSCGVLFFGNGPLFLDNEVCAERRQSLLSEQR